MASLLNTPGGGSSVSMNKAGELWGVVQFLFMSNLTRVVIDMLGVVSAGLIHMQQAQTGCKWLLLHLNGKAERDKTSAVLEKKNLLHSLKSKQTWSGCQTKHFPLENSFFRANWLQVKTHTKKQLGYVHFYCAVTFIYIQFTPNLHDKK